MTELAIIVLWLLSLVSIGWLLYMMREILKTLNDTTKLIKANNLQEYVIWEEIQSEKIEVWQPEERYKDVWSISPEDLTNLDLNPENIYNGAIWKKEKTEHFT